jgi:RecB family exonuclease
MKVPYLSASRLKTAQDCQLAYGLRYDPPNEEAVQVKWANEHRDNLQPARLGGNIHNALEEWRRPQPSGKVRRPRLDKLLELYDIECGKQEIDFDLYQDGKVMLTRWFQKRGTAKIDVLHVEQQFGSHKAPHILSNGVPVFGFIDLTLAVGDDVIELVDYKTQRAPITQAEADSNIQAGIYLAVASEIWPDKELRFTFDLTRYGTVTTVWPQSKIDSFKDWLLTKWEWIQSIEEPRATIGPACKWCAFHEICPKAQKLVQSGSWDLIVNENPIDQDEDDMLDQLQAIKAAKAILDKKKKQIEDHIKNEWFDQYAPPEERVRITERYAVKWQDRSNKVYHKHLVQKIVPPAVFGQMSTLSKGNVERLLPVLPEEVQQEVRDSATMKPFKALTIRRRQDAN